MVNLNETGSKRYHLHIRVLTVDNYLISVCTPIRGYFAFYQFYEIQKELFFLIELFFFSFSACPPTQVLLKRQKYHRGSIYCMAWSPDGKILATGSNDKSIKLFQFDSFNCMQSGDDVELNIHNGTVRELAFVPNRAGLLISGGAGNNS